MVSIDLLLTEPGRIARQVGRIDFLTLPVQKEDDYVLVPPAIVSFAEVQAVSEDLARSAIQGRIGRYDWRRIS
jgi:hypothetical protein